MPKGFPIVFEMAEKNVNKQINTMTSTAYLCVMFLRSEVKPGVTGPAPALVSSKVRQRGIHTSGSDITAVMAASCCTVDEAGRVSFQEDLSQCKTEILDFRAIQSLKKKCLGTLIYWTDCSVIMTV